MSLASIQPPVWAAGAVPLRGSGKKREVMIVHRPAYDDWTLPKGKPRAGELLPATAVREVGEETGVSVRLGAPLTPIRYPMAQVMKIVSWWVGTTVTSATHKPDAEVDRAEWHSLKAASKTLTYADERQILAEAADLPATTPLVILRHAKAVRRDAWKKADRLRPLSGRGREQLRYVAQILRPFGVTQLISSTATRCVQTLTPYAKARQSTIVTTAGLAEDTAQDREVEAYMARLARQCGQSGAATVVCGHRPVLPAMLAGVGLPYHPMATAACVIAHLDGDGQVVRAEWHDTLRAKL